MQASYKRNIGLDIIKIICTILILFHHYQQYTNTYFYRGINFYGGKISFGYVVEVFFLISGWLMVPYVEKIRDKMSFPSFMYKRLIRLLTSLILSTILFDVLLYVYMNRYSGTFMNLEEISIFGSVITALGLGTWGITPNYYINDVCWYVSVLIFCYILMWILVWLSKKTKVPVVILLCIPVVAGVIRGFVPTLKILPFYTIGMSRGYIHFFGGLILGIIYRQFKHESARTGEQSKPVSIICRFIESVSSSLLDIYLLQLCVLIIFFISSNHLPIRMVSGKTMILFACATFALGYMYHITVGKLIFHLLDKAGRKRNMY